MNRDVPTIDPKLKLASAVGMMLDRNLSCLPVVADGRALGLLTHDDIMVTLQCTLQLLREINDEHRGVLLGTLSTPALKTESS